MNTKIKKALIYSGITVDVLITVFLFVISIIMLATMPVLEETQFKDMKSYYEANPGFITYLQANPTTYLLSCVLPLVVLLIANVILLVLYINKAGKKKAELADLSDEQKAALRAELMKDMQASEEPKKEE